MKKLTIIILSLVFLSIPSIAFAGKETGPYIGGSLGYSSLDFAKSSVNLDDNDQGFKVFGGYNFGLVPLIDIAFEGSYVDFGEASVNYGTNLDVGIKAWDAFGLVCFNTGPFGIFGKVGHVWWDAEANVLSATLGRSSSDMAYGIGVRFQFTSIAVRAEYEMFDLDIADVDYFSVGVSWTF